jgi:DME family drug/metabolite transporter
MTRTIAAPLPPLEPGAYARGVALVVTAGVAWSTAGIVVRSMDAAQPWQIVFYRSVAMIATLLAVIAVRRRGRVVEAFVNTGWAGVVGGLCMAGAFIGFFLSVVRTTVANVLFIQSVSIFIAAFLGWLLMGERVGRHTWAASIVATGGIGLMVADGLSAGGLVGNLIALAIAVGFGGFTVAIRHGRRVDMLPTACLAGMFAMAAAAIITDSFALSLHDLALCLFLGCTQVGLGLTLYVMGARTIPAVQLTLLATTEVILGPIWVWIGVGETPTLLALAGGALVLSAVVYQALKGRESAQA